MILLRLLQIGACVAGMALGAEARPFTVLVYNVENLFDGDGVSVYDDYRPNIYSPEHVKTKVANIARVVATIEGGKGPDIILFQEIEVDRTPDREPSSEARLLAALEARGLRGYTVVAGSDSATSMHEDGNPRAIKCVVFTRFPVKAVRNHPTLTARNILEVELDVDGARLFVFDNHWKSGASDPVTEKIRIANARTLRSRLDAILKADPHADIVIGGDFNSQYNQGPRFKSTMPESALNDVLGSQGNELALRGSKVDLYNLWYELPPERRGSDVYRGEWGTLMQIILSRGLYDRRGVQYVDNSFAVASVPGLNAGPEGLPVRWSNEGAAGSGFSDHFPLVARFTTVTGKGEDGWMPLVRPSESDDSPLQPPRASERVADVSKAIDLAAISDPGLLRDGSLSGKIVLVKGRVGAGKRLTVEVRGELWDVWVPEPAMRERIRAAWEEGEVVSFYGLLGQFKGKWQFTIERAEWVK